MNPNDHDLDSMLNEAFDGRRHSVAARPSLGDVRRRARRRQRRTAGGITVAAAVVGVGGVAALATRDPGSPGAAGGPDGSVECLSVPTTTLPPMGDPTSTVTTIEWDGVSPTTSFDVTVASTTPGAPDGFYAVQPGDGSVRWIARKFDIAVEDLLTLNGLTDPDATLEPGEVLRITTAALNGEYLEPGASTSLFPPIATSTTMVEGDVFVTATGPAVESTAPCEPVGTSPNPVEPTTTYTGRGQVLVVDASGLEGAVDEVSELLARMNGYIDVTVVTGTRTVEQTMVMPTSNDQALIDEVLGAVGVTGFDTWTPDLVPADTVFDGAVVVVIGADWSDRWAAANTTSTTAP